MAKLEFQVMPDTFNAGPWLTPLDNFHTGTLKRWLEAVRVSPNNYYMIIHDNRQVVTNYLNVKEALSTRGHVPNKQERKKARQLKAK